MDVEAVTPFALSLSKGGGSWFDKLTTNGTTMERS